MLELEYVRKKKLYFSSLVTQQLPKYLHKNNNGTIKFGMKYYVYFYLFLFFIANFNIHHFFPYSMDCERN